MGKKPILFNLELMIVCYFVPKETRYEQIKSQDFQESLVFLYFHLLRIDFSREDVNQEKK